MYAATPNKTSMTKVLTIVFVLPESWLYEKLGTGTAAASNSSFAPNSAVIGSCEANGAAGLISTAGFSSAGATAAPAEDPVLAAIGSADPLSFGAHVCSTGAALAPVGSGMDSSKAASAASGAGS